MSATVLQKKSRDVRATGWQGLATLHEAATAPRLMLAAFVLAVPLGAAFDLTRPGSQPASTAAAAVAMPSLVPSGLRDSLSSLFDILGADLRLADAPAPSPSRTYVSTLAAKVAEAVENRLLDPQFPLNADAAAVLAGPVPREAVFAGCGEGPVSVARHRWGADRQDAPGGNLVEIVLQRHGCPTAALATFTAAQDNVGTRLHAYSSRMSAPPAAR